MKLFLLGSDLRAHRALRRCFATLLLVFIGCKAAGAADEPWILVDTDKQTLLVLAGTERRPGRVLGRFRGVALGRGGAKPDHLRGSDTTPLGSFRVAWINQDSRFVLFFGLDFPTAEHAERAYKQQWIDKATYDEILDALLNDQLPPQDTPLGGAIGIHGVGSGDTEIHRRFNWTDGCVALTNAQIARLERWIHIGTRVVIR